MKLLLKTPLQTAKNTSQTVISSGSKIANAFYEQVYRFYYRKPVLLLPTLLLEIIATYTSFVLLVGEFDDSNSQNKSKIWGQIIGTVMTCLHIGILFVIWNYYKVNAYLMKTDYLFINTARGQVENNLSAVEKHSALLKGLSPDNEYSSIINSFIHRARGILRNLNSKQPIIQCAASPLPYGVALLDSIRNGLTAITIEQYFDQDGKLELAETLIIISGITVLLTAMDVYTWNLFWKNIQNINQRLNFLDQFEQVQESTLEAQIKIETLYTGVQ